MGGGGPFGTAAILQIDYEPVFGTWVLPWRERKQGAGSEEGVVALLVLKCIA